MATIELIHKRVGNDIAIEVQLVENGEPVSWDGITRIYASLYSVPQRVRMGMCRVDGPAPLDPTRLRLTYSAKQPQYLGLAKLVMEFDYNGTTCSVDTPALVFVNATADEGLGYVEVGIEPSVDPTINSLKIIIGGERNVEWGDIIGDIKRQEDLKSALAAKQDKIADLADIRAGAAAGATAYQKPASGIPASDLAPGVVDDVIRFTPQSLTGTQKGQARDNIGAMSAEDVASLTSEEFLTVASLPTASASTVGKIYLVGPDGNGDYDRWITSYDGADYTWVQVGTTAMDLSGYASEAQVDAVDQKVGTPSSAFQRLDLALTLGYYDLTGATAPATISSTTNYNLCCELPSSAGDQYKIWGYSGSSVLLYAFIDGSRNILEVAAASTSYRTAPAELTAPSGTEAIIINFCFCDPSQDKAEQYLPLPLADTMYGGTGELWTATAQALTADKYYNTNNTNVSTSPSTSSGTYCCKISVQEGDIFRITGEGGATANRLWATAASDNERLRRPGTGIDRRSVPEIVQIQSGEAILVVNLSNYSSSTDKVEKLTSAPVHLDGLMDEVGDLDNRVTALEALPQPTVVDSLDSTSTTDALSANQGRVLNEDINGVTTEQTEDQEVIGNKYFNTANSRVPSKTNLSDSSGNACVYVNVAPGDKYRIYGVGDSSNLQLYAMADADRYVVEDGTPGVAMNTRTNPLDLTIPEGVAILVVNLKGYDSSRDRVQKVTYVTSTCVKTRLDALERADIDLAALALPLKGKHVMFFGDSVTDFTYNGKGLVQYFGEASGAYVHKAAVAGTRFVERTTPVDTPTSSTQAYAALDICNMVKAWCEADYAKQDAATTYLNDHTARVNALKNNPIAGVDVVCIGGGTNDMTSSSPIGNDSDNTFSTIKGSINKMVEMLLTVNPKLKIYFYSPVVGYHGAGGRTDANWDDNYHFSSGLTKPEYIDIFAARAKGNHIPYINLYWNLGWNQTNFSNYFLDTDDHHPYKGFDVLGRRLYQQVISLME